jgi:hypothetical protein
LVREARRGREEEDANCGRGSEKARAAKNSVDHVKKPFVGAGGGGSI